MNRPKIFKIKLERDEHLDFLEQAIPDPKGRTFKFGRQREDMPFLEVDEEASIVVQCSNCRVIHLHKTWEENDNRCMNCSGQKTNKELELTAFSGEPQIINFGSEPQEFIEGQSLVLFWQVENATSVFLDGRAVQTYGKEEIKIYDTYIEFTLKATNPRIFLPDHKKTETLLVQAAEPEILHFDAKDKVLQPGKSLKINIRLRNAPRYQLDAHYEDGRIITLYKDQSKPGDGGKTELNLNHEMEGPCMLFIRAFNADKECRSEPLYIEIPKVRFSEELQTDRWTAVAGSLIQLKWKVENANRVFLQDGENEEVVDGTQHDYVPKDGHGILFLHLVAYGDFGQRVSSNTIRILIARIANFRSYSNYNAQSPRFFLAWEGSYLKNISLSPPPMLTKVSLHESEENLEIPSITEPTTYTLTASSEGEKNIVKELKLLPVSIRKFEPKGSEAIIGTTCTVYWEVDNARRVDIEGIISNAKGNHHTFKVTEEHRSLTLTAWGDAGMAQHFVALQIFSPPKMGDINLPLMRLRLEFNFSRIQLPAFPFFAKRLPLRFDMEANSRQVFLEDALRLLVAPSQFLFSLRRKWQVPIASQREINSSIFLINQYLQDLMRVTYQRLRSKIKSEKNAQSNG